MSEGVVDIEVETVGTPAEIQASKRRRWPLVPTVLAGLAAFLTGLLMLTMVFGDPYLLVPASHVPADGVKVHDDWAARDTDGGPDVVGISCPSFFSWLRGTRPQVCSNAASLSAGETIAFLLPTVVFALVARWGWRASRGRSMPVRLRRVAGAVAVLLLSVGLGWGAWHRYERPWVPEELAAWKEPARPAMARIEAAVQESSSAGRAEDPARLVDACGELRSSAQAFRESAMPAPEPGLNAALVTALDAQEAYAVACVTSWLSNDVQSVVASMPQLLEMGIQWRTVADWLAALFHG